MAEILEHPQLKRARPTGEEDERRSALRHHLTEVESGLARLKGLLHCQRSLMEGSLELASVSETLSIFRAELEGMSVLDQTIGELVSNITDSFYDLHEAAMAAAEAAVSAS